MRRNKLRLASWLWLGAFVLHNLEEVVLNLPQWMQQHGLMHWTQDWWLFVVATLVLNAVAIGAVIGKNRLLLTFGAIALLLNAAAHITFSVVSGEYGPGLGTAVFLITPTSIWLLLEFKNNGQTTPSI